MVLLLLLNTLPWRHPSPKVFPVSVNMSDTDKCATSMKGQVCPMWRSYEKMALASLLSIRGRKVMQQSSCHLGSRTSYQNDSQWQWCTSVASLLFSFGTFMLVLLFWGFKLKRCLIFVWAFQITEENNQVWHSMLILNHFLIEFTVQLIYSSV